jgi:hypothetical protein
MGYAPAFSLTAFFAAERMKTIEFVAPGTAPRMRIKFFSASTE